MERSSCEGATIADPARVMFVYVDSVGERHVVENVTKTKGRSLCASFLRALFPQALNFEKQYDEILALQPRGPLQVHRIAEYDLDFLILYKETPGYFSDSTPNLQPTKLVRLSETLQVKLGEEFLYEYWTSAINWAKISSSSGLRIWEKCQV